MKDDYMEFDEIKRLYSDQWVLIADPQLDEMQQILRGKVIAHGEDPDKVDKVMLKSKEKSLAIIYTGEIDPDTVVIF